jgi:hypothetical protein
VHTREGGDTLDESTPLAPPPGDSYGISKLLAERTLAKIAARGLSTVILRPTRIYGPFSRTFTIRPLQALAQGRMMIGGDPDVAANMVYVDNVVEAIARALEAPDTMSSREYLVTDPEQRTLRQFYDDFGEPHSLRVKLAGPRPTATPRPGFMARWRDGLRTIALSAELRGMIKRVINTDPVGTWPRKLWDRSPALQARALRLFGVDSAVVYRRAGGSDDSGLTYSGESRKVSSAKAMSEIGYTAAVCRVRAVELTQMWAEHARLLPPQDRETT